MGSSGTAAEGPIQIAKQLPNAPSTRRCRRVAAEHLDDDRCRAPASSLDVIGAALLATLELDEFQSTLQVNVNFLRPVRPGRIVGKGRVAHRVGDLVFLEASLRDFDEQVIATATATARVIALDQARAAA